MKRPYVLLDRDGTIIYDRHYLSDPAAVELLPGAAAALRQLTELGCGLIVVTNQSGIGRGLFDEPRLAEIHRRFEAMLADEQVRLDAIYFCPHTDEAACRCRKPQPGMAERAAADFGFDLTQAFVIGDRHGDVDLGRAVGATSILVRTGAGRETEAAARCTPHHTADDLPAAVAWIADRIAT